MSKKAEYRKMLGLIAALGELFIIRRKRYN